MFDVLMCSGAHEVLPYDRYGFECNIVISDALFEIFRRGRSCVGPWGLIMDFFLCVL